jgi:C-terminal processing protease CtpA/Prc
VLSKQNKKTGPPNTIIIDLRGNMGGLNYDLISFIDILI